MDAAISCPTDAGAAQCSIPSEVCCEMGAATTASFACASPQACPEGCAGNTTPIACTASDECPDGSVCCGAYCGRFAFVRCTPESECLHADGGRLVCSASKVSACGCATPAPGTTLPGFYDCPRR
jgi:hypothetical protein